jgi:hypothetical protein
MNRLLPLLLLCACSSTEYGPEITEPARVVDTIHSPATHSSRVAPTFIDGKTGFTVVSVDTPEAYGVVFRCAHGKFVIYRHSLWEALDPGDSVTVHYREVYKVNRKKEAKLVDYDFLSATPIHAEAP